jgi:hypothetical protein
MAQPLQTSIIVSKGRLVNAPAVQSGGLCLVPMRKQLVDRLVGKPFALVVRVNCRRGVGNCSVVVRVAEKSAVGVVLSSIS